ncbi:YjeF N-terminal domain-like protein [Neocallimastix lanati (nom. inval.)]|uniref:NAD(P)H-hydrate epimerase n=1 Tax=Neocallimastix californiae TaxID=1754190 RepID=A0A1Y2AWG6_9FUNG|nr:YjeF N-terminal domain-like protein [Neocallimastix sp. JGI-2020a]ORY26826.1 YjeF N-terminal domain-like protein [Neocallimastix californiae]|eukprot:ORY26826.1 YjeF N-terminal domain-like protein [Neocallimastix californiae]
MALRYLGQTLAQQIDVELMSPTAGCFSIDQLMELAGFSVAQAITKVYSKEKFPRVLVCVGNNGGDGLVCARHLHHFGYKPSVFYPKQPNKLLYQNLTKQLKNLEINMVNNINDQINQSDLIVDGFSFSGGIRAPFDEIIKTLKSTTVPIVSIDIPSGWNVEQGNIDNAGLEPEMLVSLTAPKMAAKFFKGKHHYLGGRFIPPAFAKKYELNLPEYPGSDQCVKLPN